MCCIRSIPAGVVKPELIDGTRDDFEEREAVDRVVTRSTSWTTSYLDDPVLPELDALLRRYWPFAPARLTARRL